MRRQVKVGVYQTKIPKRVLRTCFASRRNERGLGINEEKFDCTAVPVVMEVRSRQDAKSVCIKGRHGAMSAGEVLEENNYYLKAGALIALRGHGRGGKRRRGERSLVAAALSKIDAGVALLVREVGCCSACSLFLLGKAEYVCLLSLLRGCFHVVETGRVPSINNIRSASTMTSADNAVRIFYLETKILFTGSSIFSFRIMRIAEKVDV